MAELRESLSEPAFIKDYRRAPSASETTGGILAGTLKEAQPVFEQAYTEAAQDVLTGSKIENVEQIPGLEGLDPRVPAGIAKPVPDKFDPSQLLNLRSIAAARKQGLISAGQAQLQVRRAINEQVKEYPGMEDEFKAYANSFFGKFGEGDQLLTPTTSEDAAGDIFKKFLTDGAKAGMINPNDPYNDIGGQKAYHKLTQQKFLWNYEREAMAYKKERGEDVSRELGNLYLGSQVEPEVGRWLIAQQNRMRQGGFILDEQVAKSEIIQIREAQKAQLSRHLREIGKSADPVLLQQYNDQIDKAWAGIITHIEEGTFSKWLEKQNKLAENFAIDKFRKNFSFVWAADKAIPNSTHLMDQIWRYQNMNDQQFKAMLSHLTPDQKQMAEFMRNQAYDPNFFSMTHRQLTSGNAMSSEDPVQRAYHESLLIDGAINLPPDADPYGNGKRGYGNVVKEEALSKLASPNSFGSSDALSVMDTLLSNANFTGTAKTDPKVAAKLKNTMTQWDRNVRSIVDANEGFGDLAQGKLEWDAENNRFTFSLSSMNQEQIKARTERARRGRVVSNHLKRHLRGDTGGIEVLNTYIQMIDKSNALGLTDIDKEDFINGVILSAEEERQNAIVEAGSPETPEPPKTRKRKE